MACISAREEKFHGFGVAAGTVEWFAIKSFTRLHFIASRPRRFRSVNYRRPGGRGPVPCLRGGRTSPVIKIFKKLYIPRHFNGRLQRASIPTSGIHRSQPPSVSLGLPFLRLRCSRSFFSRRGVCSETRPRPRPPSPRFITRPV